MRLIDADIEVNKYIETWNCTCSENGNQKVMAVEDLKYLPTVDAEPVRRGKWIREPDCGITRCSICGWSIEECIDWDYCPNCGAKMTGGIENG